MAKCLIRISGYSTIGIDLPFCPACGREIKLKSDYCPNCSLPLATIYEVLGESTSASKQSKSYSVEEIRRRYPRAYEKWTHDEDIALEEHFKKDIPIAELAKKHQRKPGAIRSRLEKLGLLSSVEMQRTSSLAGEAFTEARLRTLTNELKRDYDEYCIRAQIFEENSDEKPIQGSPILVTRIVRNLKSVLKSIRFEFPEEVSTELKKTTKLSLREWETYARNPYARAAHGFLDLNLAVALKAAIPFFENLTAIKHPLTGPRSEISVSADVQLVKKERKELEDRLQELAVQLRVKEREELERKLKLLSDRLVKGKINREDVVDAYTVQWLLGKIERSNGIFKHLATSKLARIGQRLGFRSTQSYYSGTFEGRNDYIDVVWLSENDKAIAAFEVRTRRRKLSYDFNVRDEKKLRRLDAGKKFQVIVSRITGKSYVREIIEMA